MKAKATYERWFFVYNQFLKTHRYTLGGKIEQYFLDLLENIFVSLYLPPEQKTTRLNLAIAKLDGIKFFLQLAWENKCVPNNHYIELSQKLTELGRIIYGWKRGIETKLSSHNG